jgi:hypothetical protein
MKKKHKKKPVNKPSFMILQGRNGLKQRVNLGIRGPGIPFLSYDLPVYIEPPVGLGDFEEAYAPPMLKKATFHYYRTRETEHHRYFYYVESK